MTSRSITSSKSLKPYGFCSTFHRLTPDMVKPMRNRWRYPNRLPEVLIPLERRDDLRLHSPMCVKTVALLVLRRNHSAR